MRVATARWAGGSDSCELGQAGFGKRGGRLDGFGKLLEEGPLPLRAGGLAAPLPSQQVQGRLHPVARRQLLRQLRRNSRVDQRLAFLCCNPLAAPFSPRLSCPAWLTRHGQDGPSLQTDRRAY